MRQRGTWRKAAAAAVAVLALGLPAAAALRTGDAAPAFELRQISGRPLSLADYRGKVVLLDFWVPT